MKQFTIYYKGFKKIKGYTREDALNKASKIKAGALYVQPTRTLIFDCFIDNLPFLIIVVIWLIMFKSLIELISLSALFDNRGLKLIYLMVLVILASHLPRIGRSTGRIYKDLFKF